MRLQQPSVILKLTNKFQLPTRFIRSFQEEDWVRRNSITINGARFQAGGVTVDALAQTC